MKSSPVTGPLMKGSLMHSWYGPGRQLVAGSSNSGDYYAVTLTVYPTKHGISDSLDVLGANSNSSYRRGNIYSMRKSVEMFETRVRRFIEMVKPGDCFLWKLAYLPKLPSWMSLCGKITVLGDAAHAMVPHLGMVCIHTPVNVECY